jgi:hypothetical protein
MKVIPRTYYDAKWRSEGWIWGSQDSDHTG